MERANLRLRDDVLLIAFAGSQLELVFGLLAVKLRRVLNGFPSLAGTSQIQILP